MASSCQGCNSGGTYRAWPVAGSISVMPLPVALTVTSCAIAGAASARRMVRAAAVRIESDEPQGANIVTSCLGLN